MFHYYSQLNKIERIVDTNTILNQIKYAHFLKMLILKLKDDPEIESRRLVIVAGRWGFHKTRKIQRFF